MKVIIENTNGDELMSFETASVPYITNFVNCEIADIDTNTIRIQLID